MAGYSALLGLGLFVSAPWWLLRMATTGRYREGLRERLGAVPARLRAAILNKQVIWVHAVSVGEVLAVSRLVAELQAAMNRTADGRDVDGKNTDGRAADGRWIVVISTTTRTGQALARERFGADRVFFFPLDLRWAVRAYLRALRPALMVLAESELWPRMLHECKCLEIPVAVVNARVSDRSFRRALRVKAIWARVLRKPTVWLPQSEADGERLLALGVSSEAVQVVGNLKFDPRPAGQNRMSHHLGLLLEGTRLIVAGSTLEGEEAELLALWPELRRLHPEVSLLLAPRHPERFAQVWDAIQRSGCPGFRCSQILATPATEPIAGGTILLLDTVGDLAAIYELAAVAFVGGSLVPKGGHNPLEPVQFGVPVVMGFSVENFRDIVARLQSAGGIRLVPTAGALRDTLFELLTSPGEAQEMGKRGQQVFEREGGATQRTVDALLPLARPSADRPRQAVTV
ncbi:MAG: 3-deoxy-D-manno-octulosonic acid transferase [Janthinobacterium lividum]